MSAPILVQLGAGSSIKFLHNTRGANSISAGNSRQVAAVELTDNAEFTFKENCTATKGLFRDRINCVAMETYLQHLNSLRERMNDHEDKVAWLSAEKSEQQTHIRYLQQDLESACADINKAKKEVEALSKETGQTSKFILNRQKELEALDADSRTLSQAWELMNEDMRKQSSGLLEKKLHYEKLEADARFKLQQHQADYESLKRETIEADASRGQVAEKVPGVEQTNDHGAKIIDDALMVEASDDGSQVGSELRLQQLQEEIQQAEEQLKRVVVENDQLEAGFREFEDSLRALKEEKLAEEDFMRSLQDRLEQLKEYSQDVVCGTCKHSYVIKYEGSKFVVRST